MYNSHFVLSLRAETLEVVATLKASQVLQVLNTLYLQAFLISTRSQLSQALTRSRAGNSSAENWLLVSNLLNSTFGTSQSIISASVFDLAGLNVFTVSTNISLPFNTDLYPSSGRVNFTIPEVAPAFLAGPLYNRADSNFYMSMTFPIMSNTTIFVQTTSLAGYLTIIFETDSFKSIINDSTGLNDGGKMYLFSAQNTTVHNSHQVDVTLLLPCSNNYTAGPQVTLPLSDTPVVETALESREPASDLNARPNTMVFGNAKTAVGYATFPAFQNDWVVIISEPHKKVNEPIYKLRNITLISGIAVMLICSVIIIYCVNFGVQPIYRLKQAAEQTTLSFHTEGQEKPDPPEPSAEKRNSISATKKSVGDDAHSALSAGGTPTLTCIRSNVSPAGSPAQSPKESIKESPDETTRRSTKSSSRISEITPPASPDELPVVPPPRSPVGTPGEGPKTAVALSIPSREDLHSNQHTICVQSGSESEPKDPAGNSGAVTRRMLVPTRVKVREFKYFTDELVSLQYSFNRMADELEKQYTHLEDMVRDRTKELEAAMVQAENANEAKSLFIANITHELRTPLNGILGMTAVSLTENDPSKVQRSLKLISKSGVLLLNLLNDLLTFSKNQIGNIVIEEKEFVISEITSQLSAVYSKPAREKGITIEYNVVPVLGHMVLFGDCGRILHVLLNLLSNCIKFAPQESKIDVRINCLDHDTASLDENQQHADLPWFASNSAVFESDQDSVNGSSQRTSTASGRVAQPATSSDSLGLVSQDSIPAGSQSNNSSHLQSLNHSDQLFEEAHPCLLRFEVEDQGPGVDPYRMEQLFEPFVQGDQALSRRHGGAGLGLSICKQLVSLMGGAIVLNNSPRTGGLIVTVDIPLKQTRRLAGRHAFEPHRGVIHARRRSSGVSSGSSSAEVPSLLRSTSLHLTVPPIIPTTTPVPKPKPLPAPPPSYFDIRPSAVSRTTESTLKHRINTPSTVTARSPGTPSSNGDSKPYILVAEDNIVNQEIMKRMLGLEGVRDVDLAVNGEQAVAKVEDAIRRGVHYDIVFMDIQMPYMNGFQATKVIRTQLGYTYPVVALTAFAADEESEKECRDSGMDNYLEKPVTRENLRKILVLYCKEECLTESGSSCFENALGTPTTPS